MTNEICIWKSEKKCLETTVELNFFLRLHLMRGFVTTSTELKRSFISQAKEKKNIATYWNLEYCGFTVSE